MRKGAWDVHRRIADMDIDGVYASLNFPSFLTGFGGGRLQSTTNDRELALADARGRGTTGTSRTGRAPTPTVSFRARSPGCTIPSSPRPTSCANRERGFRALSFPELPDQLGLPAIRSPYWEPLLAACEETGTVVCLHAGSGGTLPTSSEGAGA